MRQTGFSLLEWLVVMAIAGALASVGGHSVLRLLHSVHLSTEVDHMLRALWLARSEAIKHNRRVVTCKSDASDNCVTTGGWEQGWMVFPDANGNGVRDASELPLLVHRPRAGLRITGNQPVAVQVSYDHRGRTVLPSGAFQAGSVDFCSSRQPQWPGQRIVISSTGRPRIERGQLPNCQ